MIIMKLQGGLGNQMFQYAAGRSFSIKLDVELKLDISQLGNCSAPREYGLSVFNTRAIFATKDEVDSLAKDNENILKKIRRKLLRKPKNKPASYIKEDSGNFFNPNTFKPKDSVYLDGYWQSEKYFKDISITIANEFTFKNNLDDKNIKLSHEIASSDSVSIHIRRGDYVSNARFFKKHGLCSLDYYRKSVDHIKRHVKNPVFYIFSDDPDWTKNNMRMNDPCYFVTNNIGRSTYYVDMQLMSLCKHNIIANSSFSWWAAWLNKSQNKMIIAPRQWFSRELSQEEMDSIIPRNWIKI